MDRPQRSRNDPTPERRREDVSFIPLLIVFAVTLVVVLILGIIYVRNRHAGTIHEPVQPHSSSQLLSPHEIVAQNYIPTVA